MWYEHEYSHYTGQWTKRRHIDHRLKIRVDRELCREVVPMLAYVGTWKITAMIERFCCRYISAGCPFNPEHTKELFKETGTRFKRRFMGTCLKCGSARMFIINDIENLKQKCKGCRVTYLTSWVKWKQENKELLNKLSY